MSSHPRPSSPDIVDPDITIDESHLNETVLHHDVPASYFTESDEESDPDEDLTNPEDSSFQIATAHVAVNFGAQHSPATAYNLPAHIVQRLSQNPGQRHQLVEIPQSPVLVNFRNSQISPRSSAVPSPLVDEYPPIPMRSSLRENPDSRRVLREELDRLNRGDLTPEADEGRFVRGALEDITRGSMPMSLATPATPASEIASAISRQLEHAPAPVRQTASSHNPDATILPGDERLLAVARGQPLTGRGVPILSQVAEKFDDGENTPEATPRSRAGRFTSSNWVPVSDGIVRMMDPQRVKYPSQNYVPGILRWYSFLGLGVLVAAMAAVMMYCAIQSDNNDGLAGYAGSMNSSLYFVYRILPTWVGVVIMVYTHCLVSATVRLLPFACMASTDPSERVGAIFQDMYVGTFLWPHLAGPIQVKIPLCLLWLSNITVPLHAAGFVVKYYSGDWRWTACLGVTWTLTTMYLLILLGTILLCHYWTNRTTGLLWDMRSIADVIPLLSMSNVNRSYAGTQYITRRRDLMAHLENSMVDRLGYWSHDSVDPESPSTVLWHAIGRSYFQASEVEDLEKRRIKGQGGLHQTVTWTTQGEGKVPGTGGSSGGLSSDTVNSDVSDPEGLTAANGYRHWALQSVSGVVFFAMGLGIWIAFMVVTFLPSTRLVNGFNPELRIAPTSTGFSPAGFLFSFIPALLGQIMYLLFQSYELQLRIITPWTALSQANGCKAEEGLLADYPACTPGQSSIHAFQNGQYRLSLASLLSLVFSILPVLSGGLLMALSSGSVVYMYPSQPVLYVLVVLCTIYVIALGIMIPGRGKMGLPHGVGCVAEIVGYVAGWEVAGGEAFVCVKGASDLRGRLEGSSWVLRRDGIRRVLEHRK